MSLRRHRLPDANRALGTHRRTPSSEYVYTKTNRPPHSSGRIATIGSLARNSRQAHSLLSPPEFERPRMWWACLCRIHTFLRLLRVPALFAPTQSSTDSSPTPQFDPRGETPCIPAALLWFSRRCLTELTFRSMPRLRFWRRALVPGGLSRSHLQLWLLHPPSRATRVNFTPC